MFEPVRHQHAVAIGGLDDVLQCIELSLMQADSLSVIAVHRPVGQLQQLA